ncbi:MAG: hypothetical protein ACQETD_00735 [Pseudomonadota bacterium]
MAETLLPLLLDAAMLFSTVAALLGVVAGLWLLLHPGSFLRLSRRANRSYSLRRRLRPLEIRRSADRYIYRHHRGFGLFVILASCYTLYRLLFHLGDSRAAQLLGEHLNPHLGGWIFNALIAFLILAHLFTAIVGLVIHNRPSTLKSLEEQANRWISTRERSRWLDKPIHLPDQLLQARPRQTGLLLLLPSLYLATLLLTA